MNNAALGSVLLDGLKNIFAAILRIVVFTIAWSFKIASRVFDKVGDEILKFSGK